MNWVFNKAKEYKKVILHNDDKVPDKKLLKELVRNRIYVFGTNLSFTNKFIEPIPIGIENAYYQRNGDLNYYNPINIGSIKIKKIFILLVSFTTRNNPEVRSEYESILKNYNFENKKFDNLKEYRKVLSRSFFVISPPGAGIDCHRTWEAFIHKTIPVIENKYNLFPHIDLPILAVNNIRDFLNYSDKEKLKIYKKIMKKNYDMIYAQWWINYIFSK